MLLPTIELCYRCANVDVAQHAVDRVVCGVDGPSFET